jgi:hypothetical protein
MKISEIYGLPFISLQLTFRGEVLYLEKVLLDTGSASTFREFQIEIGNMDYGLEIDGILGFNFIKQAGIVINANVMELSIDKEYI